MLTPIFRELDVVQLAKEKVEAKLSLNTIRMIKLQ